MHGICKRDDLVQEVLIYQYYANNKDNEDIPFKTIFFEIAFLNRRFYTYVQYTKKNKRGKWYVGKECGESRYSFERLLEK